MRHTAQVTQVFIGKRPLAVYLAKVVTVLADHNEVLIVARGKFVLKAILVAVRAAKATGCDCRVAIGEEALEADGERVVPKIEIRLAKKAGDVVPKA